MIVQDVAALTLISGFFLHSSTLFHSRFSLKKNKKEEEAISWVCQCVYMVPIVQSFVTCMMFLMKFCLSCFCFVFYSTSPCSFPGLPFGFELDLSVKFRFRMWLEILHVQVCNRWEIKYYMFPPWTELFSNDSALRSFLSFYTATVCQQSQFLSLLINEMFLAIYSYIQWRLSEEFPVITCIIKAINSR